MRHISLFKQTTINQQSGLGTILGIILACACTYSTPIFAFDHNELQNLKSASKSLANTRKKLTAIENKRDAKEDELKREEGTLQLLQSSENQKKQEYRKILKITSDNPDIDLGDKVAEKRDSYNSQKKLVDNQKAKIRLIEESLARHNNDYRVKKSEITPLENRYYALKKAIIDKELKKRISKIRVSKRVTAEGKYSCGELKVPVCRDRARKNAEQVAVEQGSSVLINSMTEVKNFQLSKEVIRSEVGASLSDIRVEKKGWRGDDTWAVTITAIVTPRLSKHLKSQMSASIEDDLNAKLALNSPIGTMGGTYTPPPTPGLVNEDYPRQNNYSREQDNTRAREKEQQALTLESQKAAEAAAASAAAREAEAAAIAAAKALKAENKRKKEEEAKAKATKPKKRLSIGF